jgi:RNA polymerase sigma-70 factor (ECF subfamily)
MAEIALDYERLSDVELAQFVVRRDPHAVRVVTQRNNQRLFRAAFSILKNRAEAEEAVQEAYLKAFAAMDGFAGRSSLSTWLTRIAINEALARARRAERRARIEEEHQLVNLDTYREKFMASSDSARSPEANVMRRQLAKLLERAIGNLPELFRPVFVLRDIEGLSVEETSEVLQIPRETVKTRLLRARRRLQQELDPELREALHDTFPFAGANCEALTEKVLARYLALPG